MLATPSRRRWAAVALCTLAGLAGAAVNVAELRLSPPSIEPRQLDVAVAATRVALDLPTPLLGNGFAGDVAYENLRRRAVLAANLMTSEAAIRHVARRARLDPAAIAAETQVTIDVQPVMLEPDSERRAAEIAASRRPYRLEVRPAPRLPAISIYAQAPTLAEALRLADAAMPGVRDYLGELRHRQGAGPLAQVRFRQLGRARGATMTSGAAIQIAGLTFLLVFALTAAALAGLSRLRRGSAGGRRTGRAPVRTAPDRARAPRPGAPWTQPRGMLTATAALRPMAAGPAAELVLPRPVLIDPTRARGRALARTVRAAARQAGDWPRTTRVLPWMVALLLGMIWLVPFNEIEMDVAFPIDLTLDRLILPVVVATWLVALAAGGRDAPVVRLTWIHFALALVVGTACLSVVLEAHNLTRSLELDTSIKKLTLLGSYVALFVVVASVVRPGEVRAFMTLMLALASICAVGTIIEYRFEFNAFFWISDKLLPGIFEIAEVDPGGRDEIGRRLVRGPAQVSLETVAMLAMAFAVALARMLESRSTRRRVLYALATTLLMAAMVSTFRKSALVAPAAVCLTLAFFRRRELLRLAPLGLVLVLVIQVLSPGALTGVAGQLDRNRLGVTTVSDRTADYDAIRPDLWSHLAFGRGYGSYEPTSYRLLDMELLRQVIEVGVLGLLAFLGMAAVMVAVARGPIRARGPDAAVGLAVAGAAVCFVVAAALFDVTAFPHVPYILLSMAGMLAVVAARRPGAPGDGREAPWSS